MTSWKRWNSENGTHVLDLNSISLPVVCELQCCFLQGVFCSWLTRVTCQWSIKHVTQFSIVKNLLFMRNYRYFILLIHSAALIEMEMLHESLSKRQQEEMAKLEELVQSRISYLQVCLGSSTSRRLILSTFNKLLYYHDKCIMNYQFLY